MSRFNVLLLSVTVLALCLAPPFALHGAQLSRPYHATSAEPACDIHAYIKRRAQQNNESVSLKTLASPWLYMDEIFHIPQGLQYGLTGDFTTWDPMITTPPGAYVGAYVSAKLLQLLEEKGLFPGALTMHNLVTAARLTNGIALFASFVIAWVLFGARGTERALMTVLYPPVFFFSLLYYTDPCAMLALLCMLTLYVRGVLRSERAAALPMLAIALFGLWGISIRQTLIVWVLYIGAHFVIVGRVLRFFASEEGRFKSPPRHSRWPQRLMVCVGSALSDAVPLVGVGVAFIGFLIWNDWAIVLGDKNSHKPALHLAQIPYFFASVAAFSPFSCLKRLRQVRMRSVKFVIMTSVVFAGFVFCLAKGALFHQYLLADNRHYTAVLYRYVLRDEWRRCAIALPALVGFIRAFPGLFPQVRSVPTDVATRGGNRQHDAVAVIASELIFMSCLFVALVPQGLVEFRYFAAPMVIVLAHDDRRIGWFTHALDAAWMGLIDFATIYIFLARPFAAPDGSTGRYMW